MSSSKKRVVITGMGLVSCLGNEPDLFYQRLLNGESGISMIEEFPIEEIPTKFAGRVIGFDPGEYVDKKLARRADRFILFGLYAAKRAILSANIALDGSQIRDKTRAGVVMGSGVGGMSTFAENQTILLNKGPRRISPFVIPYIIPNMCGGLVAKDLGFMGPNYSISTACATSNYCILSAAKHIISGEVDIMLAGGTEAPLCPIGVAGFCALKALSERNDAPQKASRPWDKERDGFVIAEGAGVLVLESLEHALQRGAPILAELCGGGMSCDAYHMTEPHPEGLGVALTIRKALEEAGLSETDIDYINAHATSTPIGDITEIAALERVFSKPESICMNATKSMIGHSLGAAGALEACATIAAIQSGWVHPTINLENPEPIRFHLPVQKEKKDIRYALSNSFGFGGHNSSIVLGRYEG
jgi:3-oxoacyl-[acyl-carrier-protein] synthase II